MRAYKHDRRATSEHEDTLALMHYFEDTETQFQVDFGVVECIIPDRQEPTNIQTPSRYIARSA